MEEEKAVIDRERAIAEGRDAEAKEEEVYVPSVAFVGFINTSRALHINQHRTPLIPTKRLALVKSQLGLASKRLCCV